MDDQDLNNRAHNKAFAKINTLHFDIGRLHYEMLHKMYGAVSKEEIELCLESTKKDLKIWGYILKLIELDNK